LHFLGAACGAGDLDVLFVDVLFNVHLETDFVKNVTARESAHLFVVYLLKTDLTLDCFVL
jgi:hypothetical protein